MTTEQKALPSPTTKTAEQIARDKESVKAMSGARDAMAAALHRIDTLEGALRSVRSQVQDVSRSFNEHIHFTVWVGSSQTAKPAPTIFRDIDNTIRAVL